GMAEIFAEAGAKICMVGQNEERGKSAEKMVKDAGSDGFFFKADVGNPNDIKALIEETVNRYGKLDIMVNNAGRTLLSPVLQHAEEDWEYIIRNNLTSVFLGSKYASVQMVKQGHGGRIINISSIHAKISQPYSSAYTASKGGLESFTRSLASEVAPYGITVNILAPGATYAEINKNIYTPTVVAALKRRIPVGRIANPRDIACAALFIASDEAWYMTGARICMDGGHEMDGRLHGVGDDGDAYSSLIKSDA
ncbi:MAG: SDR family oxidoreductase, partial [Ruminiclostridium sp.]|nr:SDR family oxidoreductase [Ruminiclostridium sp.]